MRSIVICGLLRSTILFPHYPTNGKIFGKSCWTQNVCFGFLYKFVCNISRSQKSWAAQHVCRSAHKVPVCYSCRILMKLEIFSTDFRKVRKYRFSLKPFQWEPSYSRRTDRHYEAIIVAFRKFGKALRQASPCCCKSQLRPRNTHCCVVTRCSGFVIWRVRR